MSRTRVVVAGSSGPVGRALVEQLQGRYDVSALTKASCDLTSIPDTEVALAGAQVLVLLARPSSKLPAAIRENLEWLIGDTVARVVPRTSVGRVVLSVCAGDDVRLEALRAAAVPLSVLRGGGPESIADLVALVDGPALVERVVGNALAPAGGAQPAVVSVQRFSGPPTWSALDVARAYFEWLGQNVAGVRVDHSERVFHLSMAGVRVLTLEQVMGRSEADSCVFAISGGALARRAGRFEFRRLLNRAEVIIALMGFDPVLPLPLYRLSHGPIHTRTMRRFGAWLEAQPATARLAS